jgi:mono/diheme cytochrome c family protein
MKRTSWLIVSLSLCLLTAAAGSAWAKTSYATAWRARYTTACTTLRSAASSCVLCHTNEPDLNAYGDLLLSNSRNYAAAEAADSDGDGRTNGQEILQDCTLPGDLTSPTETFVWGALKSIYR